MGARIPVFLHQRLSEYIEIDDRVAHLYGLTDEERKIIRGESTNVKF